MPTETPTTDPKRDAHLALRGITHRYGDEGVVEDFDLELGHSEVIALLGDSGCGKTTVLRIIAGLISPDAGRILLDGEDITQTPSEKRHIGLVFQDYALFPHMTVLKNLTYGLHELPRSERKTRAAEVAELVHIGELLSRYPHQLSGGQQQRVALARALAPRPALRLLDEPFSNLDAELRQLLRLELREVLKASKTPAILVTHDAEDAAVVADRILKMEPCGGRKS